MVLTGDVNLRNVTDPNRPFALVADTLAGADVVFGNLEGCLYDSEEQLPYKAGWRHAGTAGARALVRGGFDAVGCANNVTFGRDAVLSSLAHLDEMDVAHTGSGADRASARTPAILVRDGVRYGFVQYTTVFWPIGHEATDDAPGVATVKVHTAYEPNRRIAEMPGGPPTVVTWPDSESLRRCTEEIERLRGQTDVLVASFHWGVSGSEDAAQYQTALGRAAIDAGADLVMGHGPHVIQGIELYQGRPIFHSLGNFTFGWERMTRKWVGLMATVEIDSGNVSRVACSAVRPDGQGRTMLRTTQEESDAMDTLARLSRPFGTTLDTTTDPVPVIPSPKSGRGLGWVQTGEIGNT